MQDLIERITAKANLDPAKAEKALGILLSLLKTQGNQAKVGELFARIPGAAELADRQGGGGGGLLGKLGGGLMGGPLMAVTKLQSAGLSMDQIRALGMETLDYAKEKAGPDLVKQVAGSIPGLSGYV